MKYNPLLLPFVVSLVWKFIKLPIAQREPKTSRNISCLVSKFRVCVASAVTIAEYRKRELLKIEV